MDLILEVRTGRERVTMACRGKLIGGKEAEAFRRNSMLLMGGFDKLIIDMGGVSTVDCGGLGSLAAVLGFALDKNKQVRLTNASRLMMQMLQIAHLDQFLDRDNRPLPQLVAANSDNQAIA